ncbi:myelin-oligodendrocyte glycoprotein [Lates calcarifer]|uniref:Myelin-oligodendrocyte glycoprotein n=1 Tax=Lates calcarifer TaxID=8187 RepID=A0A4W6DDK4_LATCA|nr:myelin-oligodendrocyte glycoprotein [Lates calcarifer]
MSKTNFNGFSSSVSLRTFIFILTVVSWTLVQGQPQVIGSSQPIIAAPGYDVILPCHLEPAIDVQGFTVEWSKPDLKPDPSDRLSRVEYVHLYRDRREVPDMKIPSYIRRTALFTDDMKHGNISLKIMNVTSEDEGRYKCFIPKLRSPVKFSIVRLVVDPNFMKTSTTETPLNPWTPDPKDTMEDHQTKPFIWILPVVVLLCVAAVGIAGYFIIIRQRKKPDDVESDVTLKKMLPA